MTAPVDDGKLTLEDLYLLPGDEKHELEAGVLLSEPLPGFRHGRVACRIAQLLGGHVDRHGLGEVVINDTGFVLARDPDTVRGPDVAFVCRARVERLAHPEQAFPGAPDLAIEILSPSNTPSNVHAKVADYLSAGSPLVWVLDPGHQRVRIYRTLLAPRTVDGDEELDGEDIVPGFRVMVSGILGG